MRHRGLIIGVAAATGGLLFFLVWLFTFWLALGWLLALVCGLAAAGATAALAGRAYWRSSRLLQQMTEAYTGERILYSDVASLMADGKEHTGALMVTGHRLLFQTPPDKAGAQAVRLDYPFGRINKAGNRREYFYLTAGGASYKFKVFRCDEVVDLVRAGVKAVLRERGQRAEAAAAAQAMQAELAGLEGRDSCIQA